MIEVGQNETEAALNELMEETNLDLRNGGLDRTIRPKVLGEIKIESLRLSLSVVHFDMGRNIFRYKAYPGSDFADVHMVRVKNLAENSQRLPTQWRGEPIRLSNAWMLRDIQQFGLLTSETTARLPQLLEMEIDPMAYIFKQLSRIYDLTCRISPEEAEENMNFNRKEIEDEISLCKSNLDIILDLKGLPLLNYEDYDGHSDLLSYLIKIGSVELFNKFISAGINDSSLSDSYMYDYEAIIESLIRQRHREMLIFVKEKYPDFFESAWSELAEFAGNQNLNDIADLLISDNQTAKRLSLSS
ncbi:MAG: hypothetical protein ACK4PR_06730 [Gammaproteobacteria bacterium]